MRVYFGSMTFPKGEFFDFGMGYTLGARHRGAIKLTDTEGNNVFDISSEAGEEYGDGGLQIRSKAGTTQGDGQWNVDVVGEAGLFYKNRTANVDATEDSRLLCIKQSNLERLSRRYPYIATKVFRNLNKVLATRLFTTTHRLT